MQKNQSQKEATSKSSSQSKQPKPAQALKGSVTADGYVVKKGAEHLYHLEVEIYSWKQQQPPNPPIKTSVPTVGKFNAVDYRRFLEDRERLGYTINELKHDPDPEQTARIQKEVEEAKANKKRLSN